MTTKPDELFGMPSDEEIYKYFSRYAETDVGHHVRYAVCDFRDTYAIPLLKAKDERIRELEKENHRLNLIVKQFKIWGSDVCRKCDNNRITLYASNIGMCYECNPKTRDEIEKAKK